MPYAFYAMLSRMKLITRWSLMRNTSAESVAEHTQETAMLAHALALLHNRRFGGTVCAERCVLFALYHDASEILTGDLPTPVKYHNSGLREAYRQVENTAAETLLSLLPEDLRPDYAPLLHEEMTEEERRLVKAADKLSALIKCEEELKAGNREFSVARETTEQALHALHCPAAECFLTEFLPAFSQTLDQSLS